MIRVRSAAAVALCVAGSLAHADIGVLYGVGGFSNFGRQSLYTIDPATGSATLVGSTGLAQIADIAWNPAEGRLYALTVASDLYTLNLQTGAATLVRDRAAITPEGALTFLGGRLLTSNADVLTEITPAGAFNPVGLISGEFNDISGLASNDAGTLFAYAKNGTLEDRILTVDPITGVGTALGPSGLSSAASVGGLAFSRGGLFLTDGAALHRVDTTTGAVTLIGSHGFSGFSGLAIPTPGTLALAGAGLALVARRRRAR